MVAFIDDILMLAQAKTLAEANDKLRDMMEHPNGRLEWSCTHFCEFVIDKFWVMGLTRKRAKSRGKNMHQASPKISHLPAGGIHPHH